LKARVPAEHSAFQAQRVMFAWTLPQEGGRTIPMAGVEARLGYRSPEHRKLQEQSSPALFKKKLVAFEVVIL
jgi:hypothetical protein